MLALKEMVTVLGGSSHHSDGLNWQHFYPFCGVQSGVVCAYAGKMAG
jgi:hypothetical protein